MRPKFDKKRDYNELDVLDEIVRARLFADYTCLDVSDNEEELKAAYSVVLRHITNCYDKRLKKLAKQN